MRTLATAGYALLAATDTVLAALPHRQRARLVTKPLLMPALASGLLTADRDDPAVRRTLAAQALSWGGDVALMAPGSGPFLAGLSSFLGAHLAYVAAFRSRAAAPLLDTTASRVTLGVGAVVASTIALAARRRHPHLALPVAAYGMVLSTMVATSAAVPEAHGRTTILTGTSLFLLSDVLIGVQAFLLDEPSPALDAAVMATYTTGQWFISEGVARG